jgi:Protein of unknown function (DUF454)
VGLGTVGLFIPGLPPTVFILIAFYCFSKSSPRFAQWLVEHRWLGASLGPYVGAGGLPAGEARGFGRSGYAVIGLPFQSGHVLALRRVGAGGHRLRFSCPKRVQSVGRLTG